MVQVWKHWDWCFTAVKLGFSIYFWGGKRAGLACWEQKIGHGIISLTVTHHKSSAHSATSWEILNLGFLSTLAESLTLIGWVEGKAKKERETEERGKEEETHKK